MTEPVFEIDQNTFTANVTDMNMQDAITMPQQQNGVDTTVVSHVTADPIFVR